MMEGTFWLSLLFILYAYAGYPLVLSGLTLWRKRPIRRGKIRPSVTFIITAYNEEKRIEAKIANTLSQEYPGECLEILIASDCSTDRTDEIVTSFRDRGVRLVRAQERRGKEAAQQLAVKVAKGDILVFSDVATILDAQGVANIVENFADPTVGCVSSEDRFLDRDGSVSGEGAYVRYEMWLRKLEGTVNSVVGLSGSFFAARKEVCSNWADNLQSDFNTLLNSMRQGMRGVSDPSSIGYYENLKDERKEFERKVRTVLRGISVFSKGWRMLNPLRYGLFSWQLFSHKLCRWLVPFAIIILFVSNVMLVSNAMLYRAMLLAQVAFYLVAFSNIVLKDSIKNALFKIPAFFVMVNVSILAAWYRFFKGDRMVAWEPSKR